MSYTAVGIPPSKIFIINPRGEHRFRNLDSRVLAHALINLRHTIALSDFASRQIGHRSCVKTALWGANCIALARPGHATDRSPEGSACVGELRRHSSTVMTSTWRSLVNVNQLVHSIFPPLTPPEQPETPAAREEYSDFNFWKTQPPPLVIDELDSGAKGTKK